MPRAAQVLVECPGCGKPILCLAALDWLTRVDEDPAALRLARVCELGEGIPGLVLRKRKLVCLNNLCRRRFSVYIPESSTRSAEN